MRNFDEFRDWINSFEKKELFVGDEYFITNNSVAQKVDEHNCFSNYFGDTLVFDVDDATKNRVSRIIARLYDKTPKCFSEKISKDTIHMTLHDLSSAPALTDVEADIQENERKLKELLKANPIFPQMIRMKTNNVSNSMHISLVLSLCPADKYEYEKLMKIYHFFDKVRDLHRPLVPHITLGYYNRYGFDESSVHELKKIVRELNEDSFEIILDTEKLLYQKFTSMNNYEKIFSVTEI